MIAQAYTAAGGEATLASDAAGILKGGGGYGKYFAFSLTTSGALIRVLERRAIVGDRQACWRGSRQRCPPPLLASLIFIL